MARKLSRVMLPATATAIPLAQLAVTKPASPPVKRAMTRLAAFWRSSISTNSGPIAAMASTASGTMIEAPRDVMVPDTLMMGRKPSSLRMSRFGVVRDDSAGAFMGMTFQTKRW